MKYADSKTARQHIIQEFIANKNIESQNELLLLLKGKGFNITQTTLSRDLDEIGAKKITTNTGKTSYILKKNADSLSSTSESRNKLEKLATDLVIGVDHSANLAIIHTPAGAAQYVASIIDNASLNKVLATIAGDNTVLVVTKELTDGKKVASQIWEYVQHHR